MCPPLVELFAWCKLYIILSKFLSLSKTTKLILLDSLLQEVCISSGFDGSLTLSSLGLSVCVSQSQTPFFRTKESPLTSLILTFCICANLPILDKLWVAIGKKYIATTNPILKLQYRIIYIFSNLFFIR